jgi:hypothetical protein
VPSYLGCFPLPSLPPFPSLSLPFPTIITTLEPERFPFSNI